MIKADPLRILSMAITAVGFLVAHQVQKRETREMIEEVLDEREAETKTAPKK